MEYDFPKNIDQEEANEIEQKAIGLERSYHFLEATSFYLQAAEYYLNKDIDKATHLFYKSNRLFRKN